MSGREGVYGSEASLTFEESSFLSLVFQHEEESSGEGRGVGGSVSLFFDSVTVLVGLEYSKFLRRRRQGPRLRGGSGESRFESFVRGTHSTGNFPCPDPEVFPRTL